MLNQEKNGLLIFDSFTIDSSLPKHADKKTSSNFGGFTSLTINSGATGSGIMWSDQQANPQSVSRKKSRFFSFFEKPKVGVHEFFANVMFQLKDVEAYKSKVENYLAAIEHANKMGQVALVEELQDLVDVIKKESILLDSNFKTVITEELLIKFVKDCEKGLALTYTKNFTRIIPNAVLEQKEEADKLMVFDNYVVLHYDKDSKSQKMTKKEIAKKKDPILFGVIKDVRKLYYIADWKDEYCDLTLQTFIDKFGKKAITANDITVKFKK